jgi:Anti-sigma factor NepR
MQTATKRGSKRVTPEELRNWSITKEQIGYQLRKHYLACTTEELPPRLLALLKKLDEERPELSAPQIQAVTRETKV